MGQTVLCRDYGTTVISYEKYIYLSKKYKITPCYTASALGDIIFYRNVINSATNCSGGGTGGNKYIFYMCRLPWPDHSRLRSETFTI